MSFNKNQFVYTLGTLKATFPDNTLTVVLYDKPKDSPEHFVARAHINMNGVPAPTIVYFKAKDRQEVEDAIPQDHFVWLERHPSDEPHILGCWI